MKKNNSYVSTSEEVKRLENLCNQAGIKFKQFIGIILPVELIIRFEDQPRRVFPQENIDTMAESMKSEEGISCEAGIETPVKVTPVDTPEGPKFKLIDGETRLRSAKKAGLKEIPALVQFDLSHKEILKKSILANNCRFELSLVEQAGSYKKLIEEFGWSQDQVAKHVGRHPVHVSNALKILKLHTLIQDDVLYGKIDAGYVLRLASWKPQDQLKLYKILKKEIEAHGRMPMQKVDMVIRKAAEEKGLKPIATRRGKTMKPHSVVLATSVARKLKEIADLLEEFNDLTVDQLASVDEFALDSIRTLLGQAEEACEDCASILGEKYPQKMIARAV